MHCDHALCVIFTEAWGTVIGSGILIDFGCGRGLRRYSHGVSVADVFAGRLDDGLARLVERPVYAVVCSGVGLLDQGLELKDGGHDNTDKARNGWELVTAM